MPCALSFIPIGFFTFDFLHPDRYNFNFSRPTSALKYVRLRVGRIIIITDTTTAIRAYSRVGRTHTIVRLQIRTRRKDGTENFGGFVYVLDGFPQRDFVLWVFMCPNNISLFRVYSVSILFLFLCLFFSLFRLPRRGLPRPIYTARAITPLPPLHGYHT